MSAYLSKNQQIYIAIAVLLLLCSRALLFSMTDAVGVSNDSEGDANPALDDAFLAEGDSLLPGNNNIPEPNTSNNTTSLPSPTIQSTPPTLQFERIVGFGSIRLGANEATVRELIMLDDLFDGITANSISTNPSDDSELLLATGTDYIDEAYFQFSDGALAVITIFVDNDFLAYHTLLSSFITKYGEPALFSPSLVRWQSTDAQLVLENPNIVKYADTRFLENRIESSQLQQSDRAQRNTEVINLF